MPGGKNGHIEGGSVCPFVEAWPFPLLPGGIMGGQKGGGIGGIILDVGMALPEPGVEDEFDGG